MVRRSTVTESQPRSVRRSGRVRTAPARAEGGILAAISANVVRADDRDKEVASPEEASSSSLSSSSSSSSPASAESVESTATQPPPSSIRARRRHSRAMSDDGVSSLEAGSGHDDSSSGSESESASEPETPAMPHRRHVRQGVQEPEETPAIGNDEEEEDTDDEDEIVASSRLAKPTRRQSYLDVYDKEEDDSIVEEGLSEAELVDSEDDYDPESSAAEETGGSDSSEMDEFCYEEDELAMKLQEKRKIANQSAGETLSESSKKEQSKDAASRRGRKPSKSGSAVRSRAPVRKAARSQPAVEDDSGTDDESSTIKNKVSLTTKEKRSAPTRNQKTKRVAPVKPKATRVAPAKGKASSTTRQRKVRAVPANQHPRAKGSSLDHSQSDDSVTFEDCNDLMANDGSASLQDRGDGVSLSDGGCAFSDDSSRSVGSSTASDILREENDHMKGYFMDEDTESEQSDDHNSLKRHVSNRVAATESHDSSMHESANSITIDSKIGEEDEKSDESVLEAQVCSDDEATDDEVLTVAEICNDEESDAGVPFDGGDSISNSPRQPCDMEISNSRSGAPEFASGTHEAQLSIGDVTSPNNGNGVALEVSGPVVAEDENPLELADFSKDNESNNDSDQPDACDEEEMCHETATVDDVTETPRVRIDFQTEHDRHSDANKLKPPHGATTQGNLSENEFPSTVADQDPVSFTVDESAADAVAESHLFKKLVLEASDETAKDATPDTDNENEDKITSCDVVSAPAPEVRIQESGPDTTAFGISQDTNHRDIDSDLKLDIGNTLAEKFDGDKTSSSDVVPAPAPEVRIQESGPDTTSFGISQETNHRDIDSDLNFDKVNVLAKKCDGDHLEYAAEESKDVICKTLAQQAECTPAVTETIRDAASEREDQAECMKGISTFEARKVDNVQEPLSTTWDKQENFGMNNESACDISADHHLSISLRMASIDDGVDATYSKESLEFIEEPMRNQCVSSISPFKHEELTTPTDVECPPSPPVAYLFIGKDISNEIVSPLTGQASDAFPTNELSATDKDGMGLLLTSPSTDQEPLNRSLPSFPRKSMPKQKTNGDGKENGHSEDGPRCKDKGRRREGSVREWKQGAKIGTGAFGDVHVCMNMQTGGLLAVKIMKVDESMIKDARREINFLRCLTHKNIVRYYGAENVDGQLHIFQEWVAGGSISGMLAKFGSFTLAVIRNYLSQALEGLAYLHDHRIMHRDIKGANILVSDQGIVKLADFGASKRLSSNVALTHTMRGTPYFMAPEVFEEKYSLEADIWSIGCVAFQMFTATPPWKKFGKENPVALFNLIQAHEGPPPMDLPSIVSETDGEIRHFQGLLTKTFQMDPRKRPNARELLADPFIVHTETCVDDEHTVNRSLFSPYSTSSLERFESPSRPSRRSLSRVNSTYHIRSPLLSPPLPRRRSISASSPLKSPKVDSSDWPAWARHRRSRTAEISLGSLAYSTSTCQSSEETPLHGASIMP